MTSNLPPRLRDTRTVADRVRQDRANLKNLATGFMGGRFPLRPLGRPFSDGDEDDDELEIIQFLNTDEAACPADGANIAIPLTYVPEVGSEQVFYNGTPLTRADWHRTDTYLSIPGERWFRAGKVAWVDYAYYDQEVDPDPPMFVSVSSVQGDHTSIPLPDDQQAGDLLVLVLSANNQVGCSDYRFTAKSVGTYPSVPGPTMGVWVGTDDGSGTVVSVHMDSVSGSGGADSCGAIMRIRGNPLLPATAEVATSGSGATYTPTMPAGGTFGVMAIASAVGLVASTISDDTLGHWTTRAWTPGAGSGKSSLWLGTINGAPAAGQWNQAGSSPQYVSWAGGLQ